METDNHGRVGGVTSVGISIEDNGRREEGIGGRGGGMKGLLADPAEKGVKRVPMTTHYQLKLCMCVCVCGKSNIRSLQVIL